MPINQVDAIGQPPVVDKDEEKKESTLQPIKVGEFATKFRAKYPGAYDKVDDKELANAFINTYPEYKSLIEFTDIGSGIEAGEKGIRGGLTYGIGAAQQDLSKDPIYDRIYSRIQGDVKIPEDEGYYKEAERKLKDQSKELAKMNKDLLRDYNRKIGKFQGPNLGGSNKAMTETALGNWERKAEYEDYESKQEELAKKRREVEVLSNLIKKEGVEGAKNTLRDAAILPSKGEERMAKGREIIESAPIGKGLAFEAGELIPQAGPLLAAIALSPLTSGTSLRALPTIISQTAMLGLSASQGGSALMEYDSYMAEKGLVPNQEERYGVAALNMGIEYLAENTRLTQLLPKGMTGKMFGKLMGESGGEFAGTIWKRYSQANPSMAKKVVQLLAKGPGGEAVEELFTQIGQDMTQMIYKNPEDWPTAKEFLDNGLAAMKGGAMMGLFLGGASHVAQNKVTTDRRRKQGDVTLVEDKEDGGVYEVIGKEGDNYIGIAADGSQKPILPQNVGEVQKIKVSDFERHAKLFPKSPEEAQKFREKIAAAEFKQSRVDEVNAHVEFVRHKNGQDIIKMVDDEGQQWWVKDGDVENITAGSPIMLQNDAGETKMSNGSGLQIAGVTNVLDYTDQLIEGLNMEADAITQDPTDQQMPIEEELFVGKPITIDGMQGTIVEASMPEEGITVIMVDEQGNENPVRLSPEDYGRIDEELPPEQIQQEGVTPENVQQEQAPEPVQNTRTLKARVG